jgi:uncharacterized protein YcsI (UPF0317 family)
MISNHSCTDFLNICGKNTVMCDAIDEIQMAQQYMALARAREQKKADNSKEETHLEAIAQ